MTRGLSRPKFDYLAPIRRVVSDGMPSWRTHKLSSRHLREAIEEIDYLRARVADLEERQPQSSLGRALVERRA